VLSIDDFPAATSTSRGFAQAYTRLGDGGVPLLLVHGWPETRRIWWRCIAPLAAAGFDVIVPDLRGFGDSEPGADGFGDVPAHARDLEALVRELGHERIVVAGGDLGGPVIQDISLRFPDLVDRMVLFNSPLPFDPERMAGMPLGGASESHDYFLRQGTDADGLAADLATPDQRRRYIATFHTSRFWAHPGAFTSEEVAFHTEPFADAASLRASFRPYESVFNESARSERSVMATPNPTRTLLLFGPSDHVISPRFDEMAAIVFPNRVGPFLLRDCGHFVQWEQADILVGAITSFCSDLLAESGRGS
jgi:pimeloyl-ACP methyl ester carboxylesterase